MILGLSFVLSMRASATPVIDTVGLENYKRANFESHETGWYGLNSEWAQRIYIGSNEEETSRWLIQMQAQYYKQKVQPIEGDWDEGFGNEEFLMVRLQNMGLLCQGTNANLCIEQLRSRIVDVESSCPVPTITESNRVWSVELPKSACKLTFQGGSPTYQSETLQFIGLPNTLTVYNRYAMSWQYTLEETNSYRLVEPNTADSAETSPHSAPLDD